MSSEYRAAGSSHFDPPPATIRSQNSPTRKPRTDALKLSCGGLLLAMFLLFASPAFPSDVTLAWDPNSEPHLEGYGVYFKKGAPGPPYDLFGYVAIDEITDPSNPTFTVSGLEKGAQYYFALTAYDTAGGESDFSNVVCAEVGDTITPCSTGNPGGGGGSSDNSGGGGGGGGGGGCFIDTASADAFCLNPEMVVLSALSCVLAFIRIAQRRLKRFFLQAAN